MSKPIHIAECLYADDFDDTYLSLHLLIRHSKIVARRLVVCLYVCVCVCISVSLYLCICVCVYLCFIVSLSVCVQLLPKNCAALIAVNVNRKKTKNRIPAETEKPGEESYRKHREEFTRYCQVSDCLVLEF